MNDDNHTIQPPDKHTWMIAYITNDIQEAGIVAGRLKHEGIMAILDHMPGMSAFGLTLGSWGEVRVLVHPNDYDLALDILNPPGPDQLEGGPEGDFIYNDEWDDDEPE